MVKKIVIGTLILFAAGAALYYGFHVTVTNKLEASVPLEIEIDIPEPTILFNMIVDNDVIIEDKMAATAELLEMVELGGEHIDNIVDDDFNTIKKSAKVIETKKTNFS